MNPVTQKKVFDHTHQELSSAILKNIPGLAVGFGPSCLQKKGGEGLRRHLNVTQMCTTLNCTTSEKNMLSLPFLCDTPLSERQALSIFDFLQLCNCPLESPEDPSD